MLKMERLGRQHQIPVHTQIRIAQNVATAIVETVTQRRIKLVLMGWKGVKHSSDFLFSSVVDTLIKQVTCDLVLVKLGHQPYAYPHRVDRFSHWLIPTAGGVNIPRALQLLPALVSVADASYPPNLELCRIYPPGKPPDQNAIGELKRKLQQQLRLLVISTMIPARSVSEALIHLALAKEYSLIIIGASQESLLHKAFAGDIPAAITKAVDTTVIIVRTAQ
jgi:CIC family chloride channel protein